jgi:hypothetical protein
MMDVETMNDTYATPDLPPLKLTDREQQLSDIAWDYWELLTGAIKVLEGVATYPKAMTDEDRAYLLVIAREFRNKSADLALGAATVTGEI